jgi:hypothetical protein
VVTSQRSPGPRTGRQSFPVVVSQLPLVRCSLCERTLAYHPGQATTALTAHYQREHPEALQP